MNKKLNTKRKDNVIAFVIGAILVLNVAVAYAQPTSPPPLAPTGAEYVSFTVGGIDVSGSLFDSSGDGYIDVEDHIRIREPYGLILNNSSIITNDWIDRLEIEDGEEIRLDGDVELYGSHDLNISGASYIEDSVDNLIEINDGLQVFGDIKTYGSTDFIGSFQKRYTIAWVDGSQKQTNAVACPEGTQIISCSSFTAETPDDPVNPTENFGTQMNFTSNTCRAFFRYGGEGVAIQAIEATCFDPTGNLTGDYLAPLIP